MAAALFLLDLDCSRSLARQRVFRDRLNPLDIYDEIEFISRTELQGMFSFSSKRKS